jgi:hypothetical protein
VLNVAGYFDPLLALLDRAESEGFLKREHRQMLLVETSPTLLLDALAGYEAPAHCDAVQDRATGTAASRLRPPSTRAPAGQHRRVRSRREASSHGSHPSAL